MIKFWKKCCIACVISAMAVLSNAEESNTTGLDKDALWAQVESEYIKAFEPGGGMEVYINNSGLTDYQKHETHEWIELAKATKVGFFKDFDIDQSAVAKAYEEYYETVEHILFTPNLSKEEMQSRYAAAVKKVFDDLFALFVVESVSKPAPTNSVTHRNAQRRFKSTIFQPALTKVQEEQDEKQAKNSKTAKTSIASADLSVERWEYDHGDSGYTYQINPSYATAIGENTEFKLTLPIGMTNSGTNRLFGGDNSVFDIGLDAQIKHNLNKTFFIGAHAYIGDVYASHNDQDENIIFGTLGLFGGANIKLNETFNLSLGGVVDYTHTETNSYSKYQGSLLYGAGASLGIKVCDEFAINPNVIYFRDGDIHGLNTEDKDWFDVGVDFTYTPSDAWNITLGVKQTLGYHDYTAREIHLGAGYSF